MIAKKFKKAFLVSATAAMTVLSCVTALANDRAGGTCLSISKGNMNHVSFATEYYGGDYTYIIRNEEVTIKDYTGSDKNIIVPEELGGYPVTYIGQYAFKGASMETVKLPNTVKGIEDKAFGNCSYLKSIDLGTSLKTIGIYAFFKCPALQTVNLPSTVETIEASAFNTCKGLISINIPNSVKTIGEYAFAGCTKLQTVVHNGSGTIGEYAFNGCSALEKVTLTAGITQIGEGAFSDCGNPLLVVEPSSYAERYAKANGLSYSYSASYTGLAQNSSGQWIYMQNGVQNFTFVGLVHRNGSWYYVENGKVNWGFTGLAQRNGTWYAVIKGRVDFHYTGLKQRNGVWYYVENGRVNWNANGLVLNDNGAWYYVEKGRLKSTYTGLATNPDGALWYVEKGRLNTAYTGIALYNNTWYAVVNGKVDMTFTGLKSRNGTWYYVENGVVNWNANGLKLNPANNVLYYIENGVFNSNFNGTATYNGKTVKVTNGRAAL